VVLRKKSFPHKNKAKTKSAMLNIITIVATDKGIKFAKIIARPAILLTEVWLGIRKKNTAQAIIAMAAL
jgi:hypothetical protein